MIRARALLILGLLCCMGFGPVAQAGGGHLPPPLIPTDNPSTAAKEALGARLFNDPRLSRSGDLSCASCHRPELFFTDGLARPKGVLGDLLPFNTPTLYYSAYNVTLGWGEGSPTRLEAQHLIPLFATDPIEMGLEERQLDGLAQASEYAALQRAAFGQQPFQVDTVVKALASYIRSLQPPLTPFDRYLFEDEAAALSSAAQAGMSLFFSDRLGCTQCHAALTLSGPIAHARAAPPAVFHRMGVSGSRAAFRAPTLRFVRYTAPYMHDGSLASLDEVLDHYQRQPAPSVPAFHLNAAERHQLLAFLHSL